MLHLNCVQAAKVVPAPPFGLGNLGDSCWLAGGTQVFLAACHNDPSIRGLILNHGRGIKNPDSMTTAFLTMVQKPQEQETRAFIQEMWCHEKARTEGAWGGEPDWLLHEIRLLLWHKFFILVPSMFERQRPETVFERGNELFSITFSSHRHRGAFVRYDKQWFLCNDTRITALPYNTNYIVFRDEPKKILRRFLVVKDPQWGDIRYDFADYYFMYDRGNAYYVNDFCPECHQQYGPPPQKDCSPNEHVIEHLPCGHFRHVKSGYFSSGYEGPEYCSREFADQQNPERCPLCPKTDAEEKRIEPAAPTPAVPAYSLKNFAPELHAFQRQVARHVGLKDLPPEQIQDFITAGANVFQKALQARMFQDMLAAQEYQYPVFPTGVILPPPLLAPARAWWHCSACTYLNNPARTLCEICGAAKK
jgi:rubrerythrin